MLLIGLGNALRLSGDATAEAAGFDGALNDDDAADFFVSGDKDIKGFSKTGKKDNFLTGAHIWSSTSRQTSSDMLISFSSSLVTARLNSFTSATGTAAAFALFRTAGDEPEELSGKTVVIAEGRETGIFLVFFVTAVVEEEESLFNEELALGRGAGLSCAPFLPAATASV